MVGKNTLFGGRVMPARKKSTVKKIVVAHIDRFVLTIPTEKENVLFLSEHLTGFFQRIANGFSEKRDWQEHRNKKTGRYDAYDFRAAISKLRFKPHPQLFKTVCFLDIKTLLGNPEPICSLNSKQ